MKKYKVNIKLVFDGEVTVTANTRKLAGDIIKKDFNAILGNCFSNSENIKGWHISTHSSGTLMVEHPTLYKKKS